MGVCAMSETSRGWKHAPNAECESTRPAAFIPAEIVPTIFPAFSLSFTLRNADIIENGKGRVISFRIKCNNDETE